MATAAAIGEGASEEECSICHELFILPKLLHCGHLLCRNCLVSYLKSEAKAGCPLCQNPIIKPEEKDSYKTVEEFADGLPTDLALESLIESREALKKDHQCQFCGTQVAKTLCTTCGDFFCSGCAAGHKRSSSTRHHVVEELSTLTAEKLASSRPSPCSSHSDEVCRVYCPTHGATLCLLCATVNHRLCSDMMELDTKVKEDCAELGKIGTSLTVAETAIDEAIHQLNKQLQELEQNTKKAIAEIEAKCDSLESTLKMCRSRLKQICQTTLDYMKDQVNVKKTRLMQQRGKLTMHRQVIQRSCCVSRSDISGPMCHRMKPRVKDLISCSSTLTTKTKDAPIHLPVMNLKEVSRLEEKLLKLREVETSLADIPSLNKNSFFCFHWNHGERILLSNMQQTAERRRECYRGIVMSQDAMQTNVLYEVRIDKTDNSFSSTHTCLGVVTQSPAKMTLPYWSGNLRHALLLGPTWIMVNGAKVDRNIGSGLAEVKEGGRVGLILDAARHLHWYRDGKREGKVSTQQIGPCFFMIDLCAFWKKVTALPVRRLA